MHVADTAVDTMRVLIAIDSLGGGGAEMAVARMLPGLLQRGVDVEILCLEERDIGVAKQVEASGVSIHTLTARRLPTRVIQARRLLRDRRPSVLHTTLFQASLVGRFAAAGLGVPVLTSLVNEAYGPARFADPAITPWRLRLVQRLDGWSARRLTHHSHAITRAVAESAQEQLGLDADDITVIRRGHEAGPLPGDRTRRRARIRDELGIPVEAPVVLSVGRHEYQKGHEHLLDAAAALRTTHPQLAVVIAGREGNRTEALRTRIQQRGLDGVVHLLGYRPDVADLLASADVFAFPSVYEGLGNALIEAMAAGLPVVASDLAVLREVVGGEHAGAILTPPGDAPELARGITRVLDDRNLAERLGERNRERFLAEFSLDDVLDETVALYRRIAGIGRRGNQANRLSHDSKKHNEIRRPA